MALPAYDCHSGEVGLIIVLFITIYTCDKNMYIHSPFIEQYIFLRFNFKRQRPTLVIKFGTSSPEDKIIIICTGTHTSL